MFAPSPRQVSVHLAGDIAKRLPEHVLTVGVFRDEAPQRIVEAVRVAGLGAAQMHGHETAEETKWVRARVPTVIKAFPAGDRPFCASRTSARTTCSSTGPNPGSGQVFDWRLAEGVSDHHGSSSRAACAPTTWRRPSPISAPAASTWPAGWRTSPGRKDPLLLRSSSPTRGRPTPPWRPATRWSDAVAEEPYDWRDA